VRLPKPAWDHIWRLLLVLHSDVEFRRVRRVGRWSWYPPLLVSVVLAFALLAWPLGWGIHLYAVGLPFAWLILLIRVLRDRVDAERSEKKAVRDRLRPFRSFDDVLALRRRVPGFRKPPYPRQIAKLRGVGRDIVLPDWLSLPLWWLYGALGAPLLAPFVVLFAFFERREHAFVDLRPR
jgi:hypothetical protein